MAPSRAAALGALVVLAVGAAVWWLGARSDPTPAGRPVAPVPTPESPARPDLPSEMPVPPPAKGTGIVAGRLVRRSATDSVAGEIALEFSGAAPVSTRTGGRGSFRIEGLPVGPAFTLTATSAGCLPARWQGLRIPFEGVLDLGDLEVGSGHSIEVLVTRGAMQPAEGILVTLQRQPPDGSEDADDLPGSGATPPATPVGRWTTDAGGRALLREVPPGAWYVRVEGPGLGPQARPIVFREGEAVAPLRIHLAPAHAFSGAVRLPGGGPAPGVEVVARHESWWMRGAGDLISVTGPDGRYRFDGLPEASMAILVRPIAGCLRPVTQVMIPDLARLDITLEDGVVLRGRVVEDAGGAAVAGARVTCRVWPRGLGGGDATATVDSGPDGRFELSGLPAGELAELTARKSGYLPAEIGTIGTDEPIAPGTTVEKELRLRRGGAVRGTVRDSEGNPVPGAVVRMLCFPDEKRGIHAWSARRSVARTREDGSYLLAPCVPGKGALTVDAAGYRHAEAPEDLGEAMETGRVPASIVVEVVEGGECEKDLELSTSGIVEGQVRDADGRPMAGFTVAVWEVDGTGGESSAPATDVEGRFRAEGVSPGKSRRVMAWGPGARGESTPFAVGPGETVRDVTVVVAARTGIAGTLRTRDGSPLVDARIHIVSGLGGMLSSMPLEMLGNFGGETRFPAADGSFRAEDLEPGEYAIVVFARGCAPIVVPEVAVEAGAMREGIEIVLAAGRRLEGRVVDGDGKPLRDARVYLVQHPVGLRTDGLLRQVTGDDGRFALSDLVEGTVELVVRGPGRPQVRRTVETGAKDLVVVLEDGLRVAGTVVDAATGSGIPGVRVVVTPVGAEHDVFGFLSDRLEVHRAQTDARGAFSVEDLASGSYVVVVGNGLPAEGAASDYAPLEVKGVKAGTEDLRLELIRGLAISGRLVDPEGRPVPERFQVEAIPFGPDGRIEYRKRVEAGTGEEGAFRIAGLPAGEYELRFSPGAGRFSIPRESPSAFGGTVVPRVGAGTDGLVVPIPRGLPISGRVVDEDGNPPGESGMLRIYLSKGVKDETFDREYAHVEEDGSFTTPTLALGRTYDIHADGFEGLTGGAAREIEPGAKDVVLRLTRGAAISGRLVLPDGRPAPEGVLVKAHPQGGRRRGRDGAHAKTAKDGSFRITGLAGSEYAVVGGGDGSDFAPTAASGTFKPGDSGVEIRLEPGFTVTGVLVDAEGNPVRARTFTARQNEAFENHCWGEGSADGSFRIKGLARGKVEIGAFIGDEHRNFGEFEAPAKDLRITVPPK